MTGAGFDWDVLAASSREPGEDDQEPERDPQDEQEDVSGYYTPARMVGYPQDMLWAEMPGRWLVRCPECGDEVIDRMGESGGHTADHQAVVVAQDTDGYLSDNPLGLRGGYVAVRLACQAGHSFRIVLVNHKGMEYVGIEPGLTGGRSDWRTESVYYGSDLHRYRESDTQRATRYAWEDKWIAELIAQGNVHDGGADAQLMRAITLRMIERSAHALTAADVIDSVKREVLPLTDQNGNPLLWQAGYGLFVIADRTLDSLIYDGFVIHYVDGTVSLTSATRCGRLPRLHAVTPYPPGHPVSPLEMLRWVHANAP